MGAPKGLGPSDRRIRGGLDLALCSIMFVLEHWLLAQIKMNLLGFTIEIVVNIYLSNSFHNKRLKNIIKVYLKVIRYTWVMIYKYIKLIKRGE